MAIAAQVDTEVTLAQEEAMVAIAAQADTEVILAQEEAMVAIVARVETLVIRSCWLRTLRPILHEGGKP